MTVILKNSVIHFPIGAKCFLHLYMQYNPQKKVTPLSQRDERGNRYSMRCPVPA